jgi:OHCU decarboxylase
MLAPSDRDLRQLCGSRRWAERMAARRPFATPHEMLQAADDIWWSLDAEDWLEAFRAHPRIGEATLDRDASREQSSMAAADADVRARLAQGNREYEARFGYIFIVCAAGKSAGEMLAMLKRRLQNAPDEELRVAASEQAHITRLRLNRLLT